jgi:hypothetical protein
MKEEHGTTNRMKVQTGLHAGIWLAIGAGLGDLQVMPGSMPQVNLTPLAQTPTITGASEPTPTQQ